MLRAILTIIQAGIPCEGASDSQRFLLEHFDTIKKSPSHIYCSALPFCPSSSWLYKHYSTEFSQEVKVFGGLPTGWGKCSRTVALDNIISCLSYRNNTIAFGFEGGDIVILDAVTGSQTATFSGHTDAVSCLVFSSDGRSLVSGSQDETVKLWDIQTGIVVRTFSGHTGMIFSISVSADFAIIASGSLDGSICLWSIHTGKCNCIIKQEGPVFHVRFSPTNPQYLLSVCHGKVWQWNINGHQAGPTYNGSSVTFSPDGTHFVVCNEESVTVQNSSSGVTVTKLYMANGADPQNCCFSPNGKLVAVSDEDFIHIWDITGSDPCLIETFHEGFGEISNPVFSSPSSLISVAKYKSIKFWQIGSLSTNISETDPGSASLISAGGRLLNLQAKDGIIITREGRALKVWDTSTRLCKASFQIPPKGYSKEHAQLINGKLIFTWYGDKMINLWDAEEGRLLWAVDAHGHIHDMKISQDGSRVFCLYEESLEALSAEMGEVMGQVKVKTVSLYLIHYLSVDGFWAWVHYSDSEHHGWDFGISHASPVKLLDVPPHQCYLNSTLQWVPLLRGIKNEATGKVIFWLPEKYGSIFDVQWNGHYLVVCFWSKEVLILDFSHIL